MNADRYARIREIFLEARDLNGQRRADYLLEKCGEGHTLLEEINSLFENDERATSFLQTPALGKDFALEDAGSSLFSGSQDASSDSGVTSKAEESQSASHPDSIGPYRIIALIGAGGMGVVYKAQQQNPQRLVALKVLKPGLESEKLLRRFEYEGQILGWLHHPGIAQVYEAGNAMVDGRTRPYFAMELIHGVSLTAFAEKNGLSNRQLLQLIARICEGVHHAHQKGIIHRDLKPGNILVEKTGQPKILDVGVARATDADVRTTTLQTDLGQLIETIAYMSPEQVAGEPSQLDTRSDVYALGVMLYELLVGRHPHNVASKSIPQAARQIAEEVPRSISTINKSLRGDVDTIVSRALAKEKEHRYQSALDLANDIRRYLNNQPIAARPPSVAYQLRKFAHRHKPLVASSLIGVVLVIIGMVQVVREGDRALEAEQIA